MINIQAKEQCTGCSACVSACPQQCLVLAPDCEGFFYPTVDVAKCVDCGLCNTVCPMNSEELNETTTKVYACKNVDDSVRKTSSSGGVFFQLAKEFVLNDGVVIGCAFDNDMIAKHITVNSMEEINKLKGSKYVQSNLGDIFIQIKELLHNNKTVLFSGTPCQVAGLKKYLKNKYENLYTVDILCHGVPSPKLFNDYLKSLEEIFSASAEHVDFRCKRRGWKHLYTKVMFDNGKHYYRYSSFDPYMSLFLKNISLRPSCYECKFANSYRQGDISLGDFWGIGAYDSKWDDDRGISLVLINSCKGEKMFDNVIECLETRRMNLNIAKMGQRTLYAPTPKGKLRDEFYEIYIQKGYKEAIEQVVKIPNIFVRYCYHTAQFLVNGIRKFCKKGY